MQPGSAKTQSLVLILTAFACSRAMFALFDDPEGPNLLIVSGAAAVMYLVSMTAYLPDSPAVGTKRFLLAILIQASVSAAGLYASLGW